MGRKMAEELAGKEYQSKYLDRLRQQVNTEQAIKDVEMEMYGEMAAALSRAGDKINFLLLRLEVMERDGCSDIDFNVARREVSQARQDLVIQRQACGLKFKAQEYVDDNYPLPP